ncbi:MAG: amidase [Gammaproteobacteria bacterium]
MHAQQPTGALSAAAVLELASLVGIPVDDQNMAERLVAGATAAAAAVCALREHTSQRMLQTEAPVGEPGDYPPLLEKLALKEQLAPKEKLSPKISADLARSPVRLAAAKSDPCELGLVEVAAQLTERRLRSVDLLRALFKRAERANSRTGCFLSLEPKSAYASAELADALLDEAWRQGRTPSAALLGVPLAHKDMFDREGFSTSCGSRVPGAGIAQHSATVIQRLELAGAVTVGTLNMAEFALGATGHNAAFGDCRNPWNPDYISGGSSSGCGAAVASAVAFGSLGSDTGGSVRIPAAANGVFGLKPTYGLIPRTGSMKLSPSIDVIGPFARNVEDLACLLQVVVGGDGEDTDCSMRALPDYRSAVGLAATRGIAGLRVGIPQNYFLDDLDASVRTAFERSLALFEASGARLVEVKIPAVEWMAELSRAVVYAEATALHASRLRAHAASYTPQVRMRASLGLAIPSTLHLEALQSRLSVVEEIHREVFGRCDVLLTPTLPIQLPRRDETDVGAGADLWRILGRLVRCTAPINYLGFPALSMPAGFDDHGLPIGMQLVAGPFAETTLLRAATVHELSVRSYCV